MKHTIEFDPTSNYDVKNILKFLNKYYPECFNEIGYNKSESSIEVNNLKNSIIDKDKEIEKLTKGKDEIMEFYESVKKQLLEKDSIIKELEEQLNQIKEESLNEKASLEGKVKELENIILELDPSYGQNTEKVYLEPMYDNVLCKTLIYEAPFISDVYANGDVLFYFNSKKGPHRDYIANKDKLNAYCDIEDQVMDANTIITIAPGKGIMSYDRVRISQKAKVKLIKE